MNLSGLSATVGAVNDLQPQRTTLVLSHVEDEDGITSRVVNLTEDGGLVISGHDLGPGVERVFGFGEYEFERRLSATDAETLRHLLGLTGDGDLLTAIEDRFTSTPQLEEYLQAHGVAGTFWNRIGD